MISTKVDHRMKSGKNNSDLAWKKFLIVLTVDKEILELDFYRTKKINKNTKWPLTKYSGICPFSESISPNPISKPLIKSLPQGTSPLLQIIIYQYSMTLSSANNAENFEGNFRREFLEFLIEGFQVTRKAFLVYSPTDTSCQSGNPVIYLY